MKPKQRREDSIVIWLIRITNIALFPFAVMGLLYYGVSALVLASHMSPFVIYFETYLDAMAYLALTYWTGRTILKWWRGLN